MAPGRAAGLSRAPQPLRIRFADLTGRTVFHYHLLNHEDEGMMGVLDIVPGASKARKH
ncbi:multicopper oxidase domain-containing protein [Kitasatospora sp. NPDC056138]|uniref:multicopper oxidase domain-containing protein n=1 Tax=Kitasatospora sp. NPDC056138 TaxID=3345724 RepID=UPI0035DCDF81